MNNENNPTDVVTTFESTHQKNDSESALDDGSTSYAEMQAQMQALRLELSLRESEHSAERAGWESENQNLRKELTTMLAQLNSLPLTTTSPSIQEQGNKTNGGGIMNLLTGSSQSSKDQQRIRDLLKELRTKEAHNGTFRAMLARKEEELRNVREQLESRLKQLIEVQMQLENIKKEKDKSKASTDETVKAHEAAVATLLRDRQAIRDQVASKESEISRLKEQIKKVMGNCSELNDKNAQLKQTINTLTKRLETEIGLRNLQVLECSRLRSELEDTRLNAPSFDVQQKSGLMWIDASIKLSRSRSSFEAGMQITRWDWTGLIPLDTIASIEVFLHRDDLERAKVLDRQGALIPSLNLENSSLIIDAAAVARAVDRFGSTSVRLAEHGETFKLHRSDSHSARSEHSSTTLYNQNQNQNHSIMEEDLGLVQAGWMSLLLLGARNSLKHSVCKPLLSTVHITTSPTASLKARRLLFNFNRKKNSNSTPEHLNYSTESIHDSHSSEDVTASFVCHFLSMWRPIVCQENKSHQCMDNVSVASSTRSRPNINVSNSANGNVLSQSDLSSALRTSLPSSALDDFLCGPSPVAIRNNSCNNNSNTNSPISTQKIQQPQPDAWLGALDESLASPVHISIATPKNTSSNTNYNVNVVGERNSLTSGTNSLFTDAPILRHPNAALSAHVRSHNNGRLVPESHSMYQPSHHSFRSKRGSLISGLFGKTLQAAKKAVDVVTNSLSQSQLPPQTHASYQRSNSQLSRPPPPGFVVPTASVTSATHSSIHTTPSVKAINVVSDTPVVDRETPNHIKGKLSQLNIDFRRDDHTVFAGLMPSTACKESDSETEEQDQADHENENANFVKQ